MFIVLKFWLMVGVGAWILDAVPRVFSRNRLGVLLAPFNPYDKTTKPWTT
jgi:hypothetical protein